MNPSPGRERYGRSMAAWASITAAIGHALGGDQSTGHRELTACWAATTETDHAKRCVIAHYLADLQTNLTDEVAWDERALAAHARVVDDDLASLGISSARGLAPSLHLNLGDGYLRQGRVTEAQSQLEAGLGAVGDLADDGYGTLIRNGLAALGGRIDAALSTTSEDAVEPPGA